MIDKSQRSTAQNAADAGPKQSGAGQGSASRRVVLTGAAGLMASAALPAAGVSAQSANTVPVNLQPATKEPAMNTIMTRDGTNIYFKDWGSGQPIVFSHGWPLTADAWEDQMFFLASNGYRVIAHDRRGHGRSSQPWTGNDLDTYADDLADLTNALDLRDAIHVGHSTGGGEVTRYIGRHGTGRVAKAVLVSAIPPFMLKTETNPGGLPIETFDKVRAAVLADRTQFWNDLSIPFYGWNRPGAKISEGVRQQFVYQCMMAGMPASYIGVYAWSATDLTEDLKRFDVPTLVVHGDDDQVVPIANSALRSSEMVRGAQLVVYEGAPHGLPTTHKDRLNKDLIAFIKGTS